MPGDLHSGLDEVLAGGLTQIEEWHVVEVTGTLAHWEGFPEQLWLDVVIVLHVVTGGVHDEYDVVPPVGEMLELLVELVVPLVGEVLDELVVPPLGDVLKLLNDDALPLVGEMIELVIEEVPSVSEVLELLLVTLPVGVVLGRDTQIVSAQVLEAFVVKTQLELIDPVPWQLMEVTTVVEQVVIGDVHVPVVTPLVGVVLGGGDTQIVSAHVVEALVLGTQFDVIVPDPWQPEVVIMLVEQVVIGEVQVPVVELLVLGLASTVVPPLVVVLV